MVLESKICGKVLHEIPRLQTSSAHKIKLEVVHLLANLLRFTDSGEKIRYLVTENILGLLNEELLSNANSPIFLVLALECLGFIFSKLPEMKEHFLRNYGTEVFEKC